MYSRKNIPAPFGVSPQKREDSTQTACAKTFTSTEAKKKPQDFFLLAILLLQLLSAKKEQQFGVSQ